MKIAILSRYQNQVNRGVESVVKELTERLSKSHQIEVFSGSKSDDIKFILRQDWDIIMPMNGRTQSLKVSLGRIGRSYKMVIGGHSGIGRDDIWNIAVTKPDVFIALTDYMAKWASKWAWGSKVVKIPDGVDINKFSPDGKKIVIDLPSPVILSVGALTWYKHHELAIKAIAKLEKGSLLIVGKGEEQQNLQDLGDKLLPGRFAIKSFPYEQMPEVYRSADLFTLPSWDREAFGVAYLEAMASGLGVVAPNDLPRKEIIGPAGVLVDVNDSESYARAIEKVLSSSWKSISQQQAKKFSWDSVADQYNELFDSLK